MSTATLQGDNVTISNIILIVLVLLIIASLPIWKYTRHWGGGYKLSAVAGLILAAHMYTVVFATKVP